MSQPITKDHELVCPGCGTVLREIEEPPQIKSKNIGGSSPSVILLGTAFENNIKYRFNHERNQMTYERALSRLTFICEEFHLPTWIAVDTMNRIKKKEKGLFSFREQIKQLIWILDYNEIYQAKIKLVKEKYDHVSGI